MGICPTCGHEINEHDQFCTNCGAPVNGNTDKRNLERIYKNNKGIEVAAEILLGITNSAILLIAIIYFTIILVLHGGFITGFIIFIFILIPEIWIFPMTVHAFHSIDKKKKIGVIFKIFMLLFANFVAGILLLCRDERYLK